MERSTLTDSLRRGVLRALVLVPGVYIGWLIARYGVNVPELDQWALVPIIERVHDGTLSLHDLFAQHNESRKFFPRLIFLGLSWISGWDVRWEMYASLGVALLVMLGIERLWRCTNPTDGQGGRGDQPITVFLLITTSVLVFSPVQAHNWLWGIQLVVFIPIACLVGILVIAYSGATMTRKMTLSATLALIATYSYANGMICWPLGGIALLLNRTRPIEKRGWLVLLIWAILSLAAVVPYFLGYEKPAGHPSLIEAGSDPARAALFFLAFHGAPVAAGNESHVLAASVVAGAVLLTACACAVLYLGARGFDRTLLWRAGPWLIIALYSVSSGAITTVGRFGFGLDYALAGRYTSFSIYLVIAVCMLVRVVVTDMSEDSDDTAMGRETANRITVVALTLILVGSVTAAYSGHHNIVVRRDARTQSLAALQWINVLPREEMLKRQVYPDTRLLKERVNVLDRLGMLGFSLVRADDTKLFTDVTPSEEHGRLIGVWRDESAESWRIEGWAILPERGEFADAVVLTVDDPLTGAPRPAWLVLEHGPLGRGAAPLRPPGVDPVRWPLATWSVGVPMSAIQASSRLRAWAWDAPRKRARALPGETIAR